jgi:hypothetical protein
MPDLGRERQGRTGKGFGGRPPMRMDGLAIRNHRWTPMGASAKATKSSQETGKSWKMNRNREWTRMNANKRDERGAAGSFCGSCALCGEEETWPQKAQDAQKRRTFARRHPEKGLDETHGDGHRMQLLVG